MTTMRPGRDPPITLSGAPARDRPLDLLAALQRGEGGAFGHAELLRHLGVEAARSVLLDQCVAVGARAVLDLEGPHRISVVSDRVPGCQLHQAQLVAEPPDQRPKIAKSSRRPGGP